MLKHFSLQSKRFYCVNLVCLRFEVVAVIGAFRPAYTLFCEEPLVGPYVVLYVSKPNLRRYFDLFEHMFI